jgi:GNAT superfamily N-acetyltransferase
MVEAGSVRELLPEGTSLAFKAMTELRRGHPMMETTEAFVAWVNDKQRPEGYRLVASFVEGRADAVAAAGFRHQHMLSRGSMIYVDDLVTLPEFRSGGHAHRIFDWLDEEAKRLGCDRIHLDSGPQRHDAHRFYLNHGMDIAAHHFAKALK